MPHSYPPLPLDKRCTRCDLKLVRHSAFSAARRYLFWKCVHGCQTIYVSSLELPEALRRKKQFEETRKKDTIRLSLLETRYRANLAQVINKPSLTAKDFGYLERDKQAVSRLRNKVTLSSVRYVMQKHLDGGAGRPRKSTLNEGLTVAILAAHELALMSQADILRAMGYPPARHNYTRLGQHLTAGALALRQRRNFLAAFKALSPSRLKQTCTRTLAKLSSSFKGRTSR